MMAPLLKEGWIRVEAGRIVERASGNRPDDCRDLGDCALIPGLVNCHTHLEFSDFEKPLGRPGIELADWIGEVVRSRQQANVQSATPDSSMPDSPTPASPTPESPTSIVLRRQQSIAAGLRESYAGGVRLVGEIVTFPWLTELPEEPIPEVIGFAETLGLSPERSAATLQAAVEWFDSEDRPIAEGISPHAPYSTQLNLVTTAAMYSLFRQIPLAMHLAESPAERELLESGTGPFREALERLGVWREGLFPQPKGILGLLEIIATASRFLLIHGNDLNAKEIAFLADQDHGSVVYCPRTHAYFQHAVHPLPALLEAGVRVGLGTDSRASNPDLRLWSEIQSVHKTFPQVPPETILRMATQWGAEALGRQDCGRLTDGAKPGILRVDVSAATEPELWGKLLDAPEPRWLIS
ncbi:Aminodeoxyfutalosine deaminase [Roseimaritima multifibrata]|uniref:Aminodeoxyfutalosine deaminase n=2 Tax=Roseimaritima multifibrata TaxID=1930274 RepID=A0A517MF88_9BACT|nr:Aminodeoxyfutalosine deaminase [Roseimaritima multifibrata]